MSIFKETIKPFVTNQLDARKTIISQAGDTGTKNDKGNPIFSPGVVPRADDFLRYTTGKNSWVRMSSFVDCVNIVKGDDGKLYNNGVKIGSKTYHGSELARKYILEGGTLYETKDDAGKKTGKFTLRSGVATERGIYASDIDLGGTVAQGSYRPFGYRPMPGITSVEISNKGAYGSLREATIKYNCWDKHQLEELELLFMRTGYTVLLEWGWSQYLDSSDLSNIRIKNFDIPTLDIFSTKGNPILNPPDGKNSDEVIYDSIDKLQRKTHGNYDAMLGHVKNFSWNLLPNGGFECTTVLISRGELLTGLKLNSNSISFSSPTIDTPPLSLFEQIFLNYAGLINSSEFIKTNDNSAVGQFSSGSSVTPVTVDEFKKDLQSKLTSIVLTDANEDNFSKFFNTVVFEKNFPFGFILQTDGFDGTGIEYIKMDYFISLLNLYFNIKDNKNRIISKLIIPVDTPCLASSDSVSIDPGTCLISNPKATFVTQNAANGFTPLVLSSLTIDSSGTRTFNKYTLASFLQDKTSNLGSIGNIYIAIPKILEIFRSRGSSSDGDILIIPFLKDLLTQISKALGGINDFQLHTTKSTIQIIDVKYLEQAGNKKYQFDLVGLKSICRDVRITSRIFESQSTMIAVGAGARNNVGDIYSSTQNYLNKGLQDRIIPEKQILADNKSDFQKAQDAFNNIITLQNYLNVKCAGIETNSSLGPRIIYPTPQEVTNASSLLKTLQYQINGGDVDYKAIIPFELEITLDGISGFVIGQVFTINKNILPQTYADRNVGFIITGLSHSLSNNDWVTNIKTQCCLIDNDNIQGIDIDKSKLKSNLQQILEVRKSNIILWSVIADYMTYVSYNFFTSKGTGQNTVQLDIEGFFLKNEKSFLRGDKTYQSFAVDNQKVAFFPFFKTKEGAVNSKILGTYDSPLQSWGLIWNFKDYYSKVWLPAAKTKYPNITFSDDIKATILTEIDGKQVNIIKNYENIAGLFNVPFSVSISQDGKFADALSRENHSTADCFLFRHPNFIKSMRNGWNKTFVPDPYTGYAFKTNSLLEAGLFKEIKVKVKVNADDDDDKEKKEVIDYAFNVPKKSGNYLDKTSMSKIFYTYLCLESVKNPSSPDEGFLANQVPDQAKPVVGDLSSLGEKYFSIY